VCLRLFPAFLQSPHTARVVILGVSLWALLISLSFYIFFLSRDSSVVRPCTLLVSAFCGPMHRARVRPSRCLCAPTTAAIFFAFRPRTRILHFSRSRPRERISSGCVHFSAAVIGLDALGRFPARCSTPFISPPAAPTR
jgi:hypothetical protein